MHAIRQHAFGPPETLALEVVPDPEPAPGQVRIAVAAAGVHLLDTSIRAGRSGGPFPLPALPMTPGREVAGTVDAVGDGADRGWVGRRVVAHLGQASGGYAELAVRDAGAIHALPDGMALDTAVAMIGTGRTVTGVLELAAPRAGDVVLVLGAAGGMGSLLVQAARAAGATVIGAAGGPRKLAHVRALGADHALDYTAWGQRVRPSAPWTNSGSNWFGGQRARPSAPTLLLDGVGGAVGEAAVGMLAEGGRIVAYGWSSGTPTRLDPEALAARGITVQEGLGQRIMGRPGGLRELEERSLAAAADGSLVPAVNPPFALAAAPAAHAALEGRATIGKVILRP